MENQLLSGVPNFKLYKDRAVYIGTFIGGPLVAGYLAAENFKNLEQPEKVQKAWMISIIATVVIFGSLFVIPDLERVPRYLIPILYTLIAQFLVQKYQGDAIKLHMEKGGQVYSAWRAVWIGFVGLLILLAILIAIVLILNIDLS